MTIQVFVNEATIEIWAYFQRAGTYSSPDQGVKVTLTDPKGVIKAGNISVVASASFTDGLLVTGGTSGATGIVMEKPDATTLHLQQVTGTWESGEAITDTGAGESTTTSALTTTAMTESDTGKFYYHYTPAADAEKGWWAVKALGQDGTGGSAKYGKKLGAFEVK